MKKISIIYVCPWAHRAGHWPEAVIKETAALRRAGIDVSVCTFQGILDQKEPKTMLNRSVASSWLGFALVTVTRLLRCLPKTESLAGFLERLTTLCLAIKLRKTLKYDVIYLRDGDPFIFVPFVLGLFLRNHRWAISLLGITARQSPGSLSYKLVNAPIWKPVYRRSLAKNHFIFLCENRYMKGFFETGFLDGILSRRIRIVPLGLEKSTSYIPKEEARQFLGLPEDKVVLLHFGVLHSGKDIETVLSALKEVPNTVLVHAGKVEDSTNLKGSVKRCGLQSRVYIRDCYITEADKQHYFAAADAIVLSYKRDFLQTASLCYEAAKFKLPAIASEVGELGEIIKRYQTGLVFKAENVNSLRGVLSDFLSLSQSEKEMMAINCERFCDAFSIDNWAQKCVENLKELCSSKA